MRCYILLLVLTGMALLSCRKENLSRENLSGRWRMISVKDNFTHTISTKPLDINGNVDITFSFSTSTTGLMSGVTPTNSFQAQFTVDGNGTITIPYFSTTKVMETSWGALFSDNIRYSQSYFIDKNRLNINTSSKTLNFIAQ